LAESHFDFEPQKHDRRPLLALDRRPAAGMKKNLWDEKKMPQKDRGRASNAT